MQEPQDNSGEEDMSPLPDSSPETSKTSDVNEGHEDGFDKLLSIGRGAKTNNSSLHLLGAGQPYKNNNE